MRDLAGHSVAIVLGSFEGGGVERVQTLLARELATRGASVTMIVGVARGPNRRLLPEGQRVVELGSQRARHEVMSIRRALADLTPDAVLSGQPHWNIATLLATRWLSPRPRVVIAEHTDVGALFAQGSQRLRTTLGWPMRATYPFADAAVAVSYGAAASLRRFLGRRCPEVTAIYNGVIPAGGYAQLPSPFEPGTQNIVSVGRLAEPKEPEVIVDALALLPDPRPRLWFLGDGPKQAALVERVERLGLTPNVSFCGFTDGAGAYIQHADAMVFASRREGLAVALVESLAYGTPVVATDCPSGPAEVLGGGLFGILVPVTSSKEFADALLDVLATGEAPDARDHLRQFECAHAADRYVDILWPTNPADSRR